MYAKRELIRYIEQVILVSSIYCVFIRSLIKWQY